MKGPITPGAVTMSRDIWMRQFKDRNLSTPEQRGRAASFFLKLEFIVYFVILLGITIFIVRFLW